MGDFDFGDSTHTHIEPPCLDQEPDFVDQVLSVLDYSGANPARLKLEITESMLLKDIESMGVRPLLGGARMTDALKRGPRSRRRNNRF